MDGHDGLTEQSAYPVITEAEKHAVMRELEVFGLGGTPSPDGALEIFQAKKESRFERPLYFDVTRLRDAKGTKEKAEKKGK